MTESKPPPFIPLIDDFNDNQFKEFCKYVYDNAGINLNESKRCLVRNRLQKRVRDLKLASMYDYFNFVKKNDKSELGFMINAISTNVTSFFRENYHFEFLRTKIIPELLRHKREIKIWSAGCSSGEEPYSIALTFLDHPLRPNFTIHATDINTQVLNHAREGIYDIKTISTIGEKQRNKYFVIDGNKAQVKPEVKRNVRFFELNLIKDRFPGAFDIIFCRNVIIYFDKPTKEGIIRNFHQSLNQEGYLFLGHSEIIFDKKIWAYILHSTYKKLPIQQGATK